MYCYRVYYLRRKHLINVRFFHASRPTFVLVLCGFYSKWSEKMPLEGQRIGRYSLLHSIGSGGMGEVYLAADTLIKREVAIKVIRADETSYPHRTVPQEAARLFLREARTIAVLDHPHILPLLDYGEESTAATKYAYMVMPLRQEGSFASWLEQRGNSQLLSAQDVTYFVQQAASALQYAHSHGVIHQDVKPSNFLIRKRNETPDRPELLLADFGIAKLMTVTAGPSRTVRGTAAYMAPEQWKGTSLPASDQYALAIMVYQLLTGHVPFQGRLEHVMYEHLHGQPQPPSKLVPQLPEEIDAVILRALAKQPEERFPSISAFATTFEQAVHIRVVTCMRRFLLVRRRPAAVSIVLSHCQEDAKQLCRCQREPMMVRLSVWRG
jgi:eukaryotic-like serine/threonine-protein kinase